MNLFKISELCFTSTAVLYVLAMVFYIVYLGWRKETVGFIATAGGTLGVLLQTVGLATRWIEAGISHPPFTNLYESLLFFSWGIALFYVIFEFRYRFKQGGAFIFPVVMGAMAAAILNGDKEIHDLIPALQSYWLHAHVATASLAYAGFTAAFGLSLMYLIKEDVGAGSLAGAAHLCSVLLLAISDRFYVLKGMFHMDSIISEAGSIGFPLPGRLFLAALIFLFAAGILYLIKRASWARIASAAGLIFSGVGLLALILQVRAEPLASLSANPFKITILILVIVTVVGSLLVDLKYRSILDSLPEKKVLDQMGYVSVIIAFPLMTLVIITGAVWAKYAWGDYWSWDPKETASLITWMIYTIYLHARMIAGWKGKRLAYISIAGFISVIFTFLGVNLLLPGLHAYAA